MTRQQESSVRQGRKNELYRDFQIRSEGGDNERRFHLSFSSEEPYERCWGTEILDHSEGAVNLTRLNELGCVLFNHKKDIVIGRIINCEIINGRGEADIELDTDEESEKIFQKIKSGTLKGISVGYAVNVWEEVAAGKKSVDGKYTGPCSVARNWMPYEISVVSIPADASVGVGRMLDTGNTGRGIRFFERQLTLNQNMELKKGGI